MNAQARILLNIDRVVHFRFGDSVAVKPSKGSQVRVSGYKIHPEDERGCFYELRLRYAPKDMLQAAGTVRRKLPYGLLPMSLY